VFGALLLADRAAGVRQEGTLRSGAWHPQGVSTESRWRESRDKQQPPFRGLSVFLPLFHAWTRHTLRRDCTPSGATADSRRLRLAAWLQREWGAVKEEQKSQN